MSTTIAKSRLFRVTTIVDDERLKQMRRAPELATEALAQGAQYWHTGVLPHHFEVQAHGRYGYARRSHTYIADRRKTGKPDLVFSGSLRRDLKSRSAIKIGGSYVELKLTARVLNFVPRMSQDSPDLYVKHKNGRGYPNLLREIKAITADEREDVAKVVAGELEKKFAPDDGGYWGA